MHRIVAFYTCILSVTIGTAVQAASVPQLVSHQGFLEDENSNPIDGMRSLTFAIYETTDPAGTPLWLEVHPSVHIEEGLFNVMLGSVTPMNSDLFSPPSSSTGPVERYLEVAVDGVALSPRIRLGSTPYSLSASRVDGDVSTAPGELSMSNLGGGTTGTISTVGDSAGVAFSSTGYHYYVWSTPHKATATVSNAAGTKGLITGMSTGTTQVSMLEGSVESASLESTDDSTRLSLSSARDGHTFVNNFTCDISKDLTRVSMSGDSDDDGLCDGQVVIRVRPSDPLGPGTADLELSTDRAAAGPRQSVSMDGSFSHARTTVFSDLDRDGIRDVLILSLTDSTGAVSQLDLDSDDDGLCDARVRTHASGADIGAIRSGISMTAAKNSAGTTVTPDSVVDLLDYDDDGDGISDARVRTEARGDVGAIRAGILMMAATNTIRTIVSPDSAVHVMGYDEDGDGVPDSYSESMALPTTSTYRLCFSTDGIVWSEQKLRVDSSGYKNEFEVEGQRRMLMQQDSGLVLTDATGMGYCRLRDDGTAHFSSAVAVGGASSSHYIDVQGGAYCDGSDWVNASDAASKENFRSVDGAEVLDRLADLKIQRWNYKGQGGVEHIGPTAQAFQEAFGLGADDKSISTIDPSGIALLAIQELWKQNQALHDQNREMASRNDELREELAKLSRRVEALTASR